MNLFKKLFKRDNLKPDAYPTKINGKDVDNLWDYASELICSGLKARDLMVGGVPYPRNESLESHSYADRVVRNYQLYRQLSKSLTSDNLDYGGPASQNMILQKMRTKQGMLIGVRGDWMYQPIEDGDIDVTDQLNQAKSSDVARQGLWRAQIEALAQQSAFGTSVTGLRYSRASRMPRGDQLFYTVDPLGFLFEYGKTKINGSIFDPSLMNFVIVIDYHPKGLLEDEWEREIDDNYSLVEAQDFSIWHRINRNQDFLAQTDDRIAEIKIYLRDTTREPEKVPKTKKVARLAPDQGGLPQVEGYDDVVEMGEDGKPVMTSTDRTVKLYPEHRLIVLCGRTVCYDGRGLYDHNLIPYVKGSNTIDGINPFGMGDPEIAYGTLRGINDMTRAFDNNSALSPLMLLNTKSLKNPDDPFEIRDGYTVVPVERLKPGERIEDVISFKQVPAFSQDQLEYFRMNSKWLDDLLGTPPVSYGRTFAADSGVKTQSLDDNAIRYHKPVLIEAEENLRDLAKMWMMNIRQFIAMIDHEVSVIDRKTGKPKIIMLSEIMKGVTRDFPAEVIPLASGGSYRKEMLADGLQMKGALGADLPSDYLLLKSGDPELVAMGRLHATQRAKIVALIQQLEDQGVLDQFIAQLQSTQNRNPEGGAPA